MEETDPRWGSGALRLEEPSLPSLKAKFLVDRIPQPAGRVVELGCGEGKMLKTIARVRPEAELHGCDVRMPHESSREFTFQRIVGDRLPYEDGFADTVLIVDVLEHVPSPDRMLAEARRILAPGGQLLAFVPVEGERVSFYELYRRILGRDIFVDTKDHVQAFTHRELDALLGKYFEVKEKNYAYHALGQMMDATFFAANKAKKLREFWWKDNAFYNPGKKTSGGASAMNQLLKLGNAVAWAESRLLARTRISSAGILVAGNRR